MTMLVTQGRVVAVHQGLAHVQLEARSSCSSCGAKAVCSSGSSPSRTISLPAPEGVSPGDTLEVALPQSQLDMGALIGYLLPATTTLAGALLLSGGGDAVAALGAVLGLAGGLWLTRRLSAGFVQPRLSTCSPHLIQGETP